MRIYTTCLLLALSLLGCARDNLRVRQIADPEYPAEARLRQMQGTAVVGVNIGPDGKVIWATIVSNGGSILAEESRKNAIQWIFGPFPDNCTFPIYHEITYNYVLEGKPAYIMIVPPIVKTHLPDKIEVIARPFESDSDYPPSGRGRN
jgi:TonB family protein